MCSKHVHSTVTRASRFHCLIGVINKPTTVELCISPEYHDLLWQNFLSPQCRNCSCDPDHVHLGKTLVTILRLRMADPCTKSLALAVAEILHGV